MSSTTTTLPSEGTKRLYILRGISGSGKSTLSVEILKENNITLDPSATLDKSNYILSTDDYFINPKTNLYEFDGAKIGKAHLWNQDRTEKLMQANASPLIIDNTNTQLWEMKPYVQLADKYGYAVQVREPNTPWKRDAKELAKKNVHGVPEEAIQRMLSRWETFQSLDEIRRAKAPFKKSGGGRGRGRGGAHHGGHPGGRGGSTAGAGGSSTTDTHAAPTAQ